MLDKSALAEGESIYDYPELAFDKRAGYLNRILILSDEGIGGQTHYSRLLLKSYLKEQLSSGILPQAIILVNRGVLLACSTSHLIEELRQLESKGVAILSNCSCLDAHKAMDHLAVGGVTTMGNIVELTNLAKSVITF